MHELSLFGHVSLARHEQVLNILAGLAAVQPLPIYERHLIFSPVPTSEQNKMNKKFPNKPVQIAPASYVQLVSPISETDGVDSAAAPIGTSDHDRLPGHWRARTQDIPEPEVKAVVLRRVSEHDLAEADLAQYLDRSKHNFINEFVVEGQILIHQNVLLRLHRILFFKPQDPSQPRTPQTDPTRFNDLVLVDNSGAFILEATVRIDDRTKPSLVQAATDELNRFRNEMKGSVDLRTPERLAMDTRVRA